MTFDYSTLCVRVTSNDLDSSREVRLNLSFVAKNYLNQIKSNQFYLYTAIFENDSGVFTVQTIN